MKHTEYKRIVSGADTALLFIHGIVGTPNHFARFLPLVPDSVSVWNLLLDGHGKAVRDFSATSMKKWQAQVQKAVEELAASHQKVYIIAHSMGTLLAIEQAIRTRRVTGLFLMAVPLRLHLRSTMFVNAAKVYFDIIRPDDPITLAAKHSYGIEQDRNPLKYIGWIPRYLELFKKIRHTRQTLHRLNTLCVAYQSVNDEMVSIRSVELLSKNPAIRVKRLEKSSHYHYNENDLACLLQEFSKFINQK